MHSWPGFLGVGLALALYTVLAGVPARVFNTLPAVGNFLYGKFYVDELYNALLVRPLEGFARVLWKGVDQAAIDGTVNGTAAFVDVSGEIIRTTETGQLRHYAFFMFLGTCFILLFYLVL